MKLEYHHDLSLLCVNKTHIAGLRGFLKKSLMVSVLGIASFSTFSVFGSENSVENKHYTRSFQKETRLDFHKPYPSSWDSLRLHKYLDLPNQYNTSQTFIDWLKLLSKKLDSQFCDYEELSAIIDAIALQGYNECRQSLLITFCKNNNILKKWMFKVISHLNTVNAKELALTIKKLAIIGLSVDTEFLQFWTERAKTLLRSKASHEQFKAQDLIMIIHNLSSLNIRIDTEFLQLWTERAKTLLKRKDSQVKFDAHALSIIIHGFAKLGLKIDSHFLQLWTKQARKFLKTKAFFERFDSQNSASILWSIAVTRENFDTDVINMFFEKAEYDELKIEIAHALHVAFSALSERDGVEISPSLRRRVETVLQNNKRDASPNISNFQKDLERHIKTILRKGVSLTREAWMNETMTNVDILLTVEDQQYIVEADGPCHYFANAPKTCLPANQYLRDILRVAGYKILEVPYFDWADLSFTQKNQYCTMQFRKHGMDHLLAEPQSLNAPLRNKPGVEVEETDGKTDVQTSRINLQHTDNVEAASEEQRTSSVLRLKLKSLNAQASEFTPSYMSLVHPQTDDEGISLYQV